MFSLIWLFSNMEKILSHLVRSGELQGAGLGVAAEGGGGVISYDWINQQV